MGLFDKKYCDVCGAKIGFLGNRKLEDGNLCKDCAGKLSPFFSDRRNSTVAEIKEQLAYREDNKRRLDDFLPTVTFGGSKKVYIDPIRERFIVTRLSNWRSGNPDLVSFSQVRNVETDIKETRRRSSVRIPRATRRAAIHAVTSTIMNSTLQSMLIPRGLTRLNLN